MPLKDTFKKKLSLGLKDLEFETIIGINKEEREKKQKLLIDIDIDLDVIKISSIEDTLDYDELSKKIKKIADKNHFLLETLADEILEMIFLDKRVKKAKVIIKKPSAIKDALYAFVKKEGKRCGL